MTKISVNINKIGLLRNSRGRDFPSVLDFAGRCIDLGVHGITLHPRPDQRHARYSDVGDLKSLCVERGVELNVEGYPCEGFLRKVLETEPTQCTLVPDDPAQITSDHGWDVRGHFDMLSEVVNQLKQRGIRTSLFVDHDTQELDLIQQLGADRIELYTEPYADSFSHGMNAEEVFASFQETAIAAQQLGLGVNAGHDLNLDNLPKFLTIPRVLEVSIGHALIVECIEFGVEKVLGQYLKIAVN